MRRDWLNSLKVSIGDIHRLGVSNRVSEMLQKHKSISTEDLGTFKSGKVILHINPQNLQGPDPAIL